MYFMNWCDINLLCICTRNVAASSCPDQGPPSCSSLSPLTTHTTHSLATSSTPGSSLSDSIFPLSNSLKRPPLHSFPSVSPSQTPSPPSTYFSPINNVGFSISPVITNPTGSHQQSSVITSPAGSNPLSPMSDSPTSFTSHPRNTDLQEEMDSLIAERLSVMDDICCLLSEQPSSGITALFKDKAKDVQKKLAIR